MLRFCIVSSALRPNPTASEVVPGRREAASPQPITAALRYGFRGRALRTRPGMTSSRSYDAVALTLLRQKGPVGGLGNGLIAWMQSCGRRQPVKGDWRAFNRVPIAALAVETLDRLPSDLGFTRDREIEDTHIGNSRCAPATKSIQAIKAASDRGLAAFHVLPHSKFKRVFHRAWPDLQRMKLLLPVARSCRVSFFLATICKSRCQAKVRCGRCGRRRRAPRLAGRFRNSNLKRVISGRGALARESGIHNHRPRAMDSGFATFSRVLE